VVILAVLTTITVFQRGLDVRRQLKPLDGQHAEAPSTEQ
jgi:hypothetical protein